MSDIMWTIEPFGRPSEVSPLHERGITAAVLTRQSMSADILSLDIGPVAAFEPTEWEWE